MSLVLESVLRWFQALRRAPGEITAVAMAPATYRKAAKMSAYVKPSEIPNATARADPSTEAAALRLHILGTSCRNPTPVNRVILVGKGTPATKPKSNINIAVTPARDGYGRWIIAAGTLNISNPYTRMKKPVAARDHDIVRQDARRNTLPLVILPIPNPATRKVNTRVNDNTGRPR